ncbi:duf1753-domain-containing protein [Moniliophthora roreri MCA 2997]|uniref:Duf1753-domain-containing protein n=2 Tax=Moniliophthora roreri TaxID=221103 RepID=V2Z1F7_MONRO|nr:duf1753-domain-containing protein [Moniliophthora roreri MCA 2997]
MPKLMLRPEWRLWPLSSCLGFLDLKTGVTVALLFAVLNKVAGIYGLIAVVTGAGGSFSQLSLYIYSVLALVALVWGLRAVKEEDPKQTLYFAHLFFADHIFSTSWTVYFATVWWFQNPHDGHHSANSPAQIEIIEGTVHSDIPMTDEERVAAAQKIWNHEKGTAAAFIILAWILKLYLALLIYSYASHLRKGSYRSLLRSRAPAQPSNETYESALGYPDDDEETVEDLYRLPLRTPNSGSISSFADFVNAPPGRTRKGKGLPGKQNGHAQGNPEEEDEVLFDEDELSYGSSSRGHSKHPTDDSSTDSEERSRVR